MGMLRAGTDTQISRLSLLVSVGFELRSKKYGTVNNTLDPSAMARLARALSSIWRKLTVVTLALVVLSVIADNPTSIVPPLPGPDPGYIIAESTSGLANRLRVMAAYMHIAEAQHDGAHLVFIWDITEACPGHFLSVFEPIERVIFATNASRYVLDKHSKINYENSFATFNWIMSMNNVPKNR